MFNTNDIAIVKSWNEKVTVVAPGSVVTGVHQAGRPADEIMWLPTASLKVAA